MRATRAHCTVMRKSRDSDPTADGISRLMLFFAIVYTVEGIGQAKVGVVWQPLTHYLKETQGWDSGADRRVAGGAGRAVGDQAAVRR